MKKFICMFILLTLISLLAIGFVGCNSISGDKVKLIEIKLTDENYAFVIKKGNSDLVNSFNEYMETIKASGEFDAIVAKYFENKGDKIGVNVVSVKGDDSTQKADGTFVVATNCPFEPFEYIGNSDGKVYGIDIEIAKGYADSQNLTLIVKNVDFDAIFAQVDAGYADIGMAGITKREDREKVYDFTMTYFNASQKLIVAVDNNDFNECKTVEDVEAILSSLTNKKIGYQTGTTGGMYVSGDEEWGFDGFDNITGVSYSSAQEALMDLVNGNIYAVIVDEAPAMAMVKNINKKARFYVFK